MKKLALMTWHHVDNYGTAFQALALKEALIRLGCEVDIVNYLRDEAKPLAWRKLGEYLCSIKKSILHTIEKRKYYHVDQEMFRDFFDKNFQYTHRCNTKQDFLALNNMYDGFVAGSDQIWGPNWFDPHFFLDFVTDGNKKIAYAPSLGVVDILTYPAATEMKKLVSSFAFLSAREKSACVELTKLTNRCDISNVLDPVLLLNREYWLHLTEERKSEPYMFIFFLKSRRSYFEKAIAFAKEQGLRPVIMHSTQSKDNIFSNLEAPDPIELLNLLRNASYVCTDSFHMMVFSIVFGVQFRVFNKNTAGHETAQNRRLQELLQALGIPYCEYTGDFLEKVLFDEVYSKLDELRVHSEAYLRNAVNSLEQNKHIMSEEPLCWACESCPGKMNNSCNSYFQSHATTIGAIMENWKFTLDEQCFECEKLRKTTRNQKCVKPLFYHALLSDIGNKKVPVKIFFKYYALYEFPYQIKNAASMLLRRNSYSSNKEQ